MPITKVEPGGDKVDVKTAAKMIGCSLTQLYRILGAGGLPGYRQRGKKKGVLIPVAAIESFTEVLPLQSAAAKPTPKPSRSAKGKAKRGAKS